MVELFRFRRNLGWIVAIIFPAVVVFTVGLAISPDVHHIPIALQGDPTIMNSLEEALDDEQFTKVETDDLEKAFRRGNIRVAVIGENNSGTLNFIIQIDASETSIKTQSKWTLEATIRSLFSQYPLEIEIKEKFGGKSSFAYFAPGVLALAIFTGGLFGASETILHERERGTLDNVITSPTSPTRFIAEKIVAFSLTMGMSSVITAILVLALGATITDPFAIIVTILIAQLAFVSMGVAVSAVIPNEDVAGEINAVIMFPVMFFSGCFFSLYMMDPLIQNVSMINPLTHLNEACRTLLLKNGTLSDVIVPLSLVFGSAVIFTSVGIVLMWRLTRGMQH